MYILTFVSTHAALPNLKSKSALPFLGLCLCFSDLRKERNLILFLWKFSLGSNISSPLINLLSHFLKIRLSESALYIYLFLSSLNFPVLSLENNCTLFSSSVFISFSPVCFCLVIAAQTETLRRIQIHKVLELFLHSSPLNFFISVFNSQG